MLRLLSPQPLEQLGWGLALSIAQLGASMPRWPSRCSASARVHRSIALEADARHLLTDVWTSAGVVIGIVAVGLTGWLWLDPLLAIGVALNIVREGVKLVWRSSQGLMDEALDPESLALLHATLERFAASVPEGAQLRFDDIVDAPRRPAPLCRPAHARAGRLVAASAPRPCAMRSSRR